MCLMLVRGMGINWERGAGCRVMKNPCTHANEGNSRGRWRKATQGKQGVMKVTCKSSKEATAPTTGITVKGRADAGQVCIISHALFIHFCTLFLTSPPEGLAWSPQNIYPRAGQFQMKFQGDHQSIRIGDS